MTKPASRQTKLHQAKAVARHRKQQEEKKNLGAEYVFSQPNRAQRRAKKEKP